MNKLKNIGIEVYIYKRDGCNSMVVENPRMIRNTKPEEFEKITLIISAETIHKYSNILKTEEKEEENQ